MLGENGIGQVRLKWGSGEKLTLEENLMGFIAEHYVGQRSNGILFF